LSPRYLEEHCLLPLGIDGDGALALAAGGTLDDTVRDELARLYGRPLRIVEAPEGEIRAAILGAHREVAAPPNGSGAATLGDRADETSDDLRALASQGPVITIVNVMLTDALRAEA